MVQSSISTIILLGSQMTFGGAQKLLLEQGDWYSSQGYKVSVVFFYDRDGLHQKWQDAHPFLIHNLNAFDYQKGVLGSLIKLISGSWKLFLLFRLKKPDAVITFTHDSNTLGLPIAWLAGVPVRIGTHLGKIRGMTSSRERLHTWLVNTGIIQVLIASSKRTRDDSVENGVDFERTRIISNAIKPFDLKSIDRDSIRDKLGLRNRDIFLLAVGRLVYEKGHEFLVKAMSKISDDHVVAGICGAGPLYDNLQKEIASLKLDEKVLLLGQWEKLLELLAAADIFVLPSRWEGLPLALLEAMVAGLPVIATRVEGVDEVIEDGVHGFLIPVEDSQALAKAILQLSPDPELRQIMGEAARKRILETYTVDRMCEQYLHLMEQGLGRKKA